MTKMQPKHRLNLRRYLPFCLFALLLLALYASGLHHYLNFHTLKSEHLKLSSTVALHPLLAQAVFISVYAVSVFLVIPDSILLSILAGFLFPLPLAMFDIALSETLGALLFFLMSRGAFGPTMQKIRTPYLLKIQQEFHDHAISYLLFLRASHLFPFWIVNILAACFQVRTWSFIWTTFLGVIPFAYVFAEGGKGLAKFLNSNEAFTIRALLNPGVDLALIGIALLALIPVVVKKLQRR